MILRKTCALFAVVAACATAQTNVQFECSAIGPFPPFGSPPDCEGVTGYGAEVSADAACGMPTVGAKHAYLPATGYVSYLPQGGAILRPLATPLTEIRIPLEPDTVGVLIDYSWFNAEGLNAPYNDGYDLSICDASGQATRVVARGDTFSHPSGCTGALTASVTFLPTAPGAYLSVVSFNEGDGQVSSVLRVDDVRIRRGTGFECQAPGAPLGLAPDCEGSTGRAGTGAVATVATTPACGMPTQGAQYARLTAGGAVPVFVGGDTVVRPVPATFTEIRVPLPPDATSVAFDYAFVNQEVYGPQSATDGFDVSTVDPSGNRVALLVNGDTAGTPVGCAGYQRFTAAIPYSPAAAYLSFVVFNGVDQLADSELLIDDVCFLGRPRLTFSAPLGAGSLALRIDCGGPGASFYMPVALAAVDFPHGPVFGVDLTLLDVVLQISAGAPFVGLLDASGSYEFGPVVGLPGGLEVFANVLTGIETFEPTVGVPVSFAVP